MAGAYQGSSFVLLDDSLDRSPGGFNGSMATSVSIVDNDFTIMGDMLASGNYSVQATEVRKSLALVNATSWLFDFSRDLLFPGHLDYASATLSRSQQGGRTHKGLPYDVLSRGSIVEVATAIPTTALVSVEVRQGLPPGAQHPQ